jgi:flavin-dependent dehydrogenase
MIIVGAGGAGLFLSENVRKNQIQSGSKSLKEPEKITILEEHNKLGLPVQCTGILTDEINKLLSPRDINKFALNKITNTTIFSPNNKVNLKIKTNIIIDNVKFIYHLAKRAEKSGVQILTNHRYIANNGAEIKVRNTLTNKIKILRDSTLIGADGPQSHVAANNNLNTKRDYLLGIQARIKIKDLEKNNIDFYPYIAEYAWSTPENDEISRVGIAVPLKDQNIKNKLFNDFLKKYPGHKLEIQAGLIPLHKPNRKIFLQKKSFSVALVGDAASQIKNTTGGGIIPGMKSALELSKGINSYSKNLKKIDKELYLHYIINRALRNYSDKDWDRLILKVNDEKIKTILENTNRDNALKLVLSLAKHPSMITEGMRALTKIR